MRGVRLHGETDRLIDNAVDDAQIVAVNDDAVFFGQVVNAAAEHVVFGNDFFNVKAIVKALPTVGRRAAL